MSDVPEHRVEWTGRTEGGLSSWRWFTGFVRFTGPWLGPLLLRVGTWFALPFLTERRRGAELFFAQLRGRRVNVLRRWLDTYRTFLAFTFAWFDRTWAFTHGRQVVHARVTGGEHIAQAIARGHGVVLLTAHIGNFALGAWLLGHGETPVNVVMVDHEVEAVKQFQRELAGAHQPTIIAVNKSQWSALQILGALRRNEIVGMQGDRAGGPRLLSLPVLGKAASVPLGPYHVAYAAQSTVLATFTRRTGVLRYEIEVSPPLTLSESGEEGAREYVALLEREIRARPYEWFNLYSFWDAA